MKLLKIQREKQFIRYTMQAKGHMASEDRVITAHEAPLPDFNEAMDQLATSILELGEHPESWRSTIQVKSLEIKYTKGGTRQVQISYSKYYIKTSSSKIEKTPFFFIEDGTNDEYFDRECSETTVALISKMIFEAERYIGGERQQMILPIGEDDGDPVEPEDGDQMDMFHGDTDWSSVPVPFHDETEIPDFPNMEKGHSLWLIERYEDKAALKQDIEFNFSAMIDARAQLETCQAKARQIINDL